jgi:hypothetical protein
MTLDQISKELDYRDNAAEDCKWDDDLFEYSYEELSVLECLLEDNKNYSHTDLCRILDEQ